MIRRKAYISEQELQDLGFGTRVAQQSRLRLLNRDGSFNVERTGLSFFRALDLYHVLLNMTWGKFFLSTFIAYCAVNAVFGAGFLLCGPGAVQGLGGTTGFERYMEAFFFSVETFTTIGYGNIIPVNFAADLLVTIDAFVGSLGFALATGLLFARFSRPTAKLVFSERGLIAPYRGITAFEFRIANQRPSQLIDVDAKVLLSRMEEVNGTRMRRFYNLPLERERVVFFPLAWTVVHPIDEESPLNGLTPEDLRETQSEFLVLITAIDDTFSQTVHTRTSYRYDEVKWRHKFRDLFTSDHNGDGILRIDLRRLHDIEEVEM